MTIIWRSKLIWIFTAELGPWCLAVNSEGFFFLIFEGIYVTAQVIDP